MKDNQNWTYIAILALSAYVSSSSSLLDDDDSSLFYEESLSSSEEGGMNSFDPMTMMTVKGEAIQLERTSYESELSMVRRPASLPPPQFRTDSSCYYCHIFLNGQGNGFGFGETETQTEAAPTVGTPCADFNSKDCFYTNQAHKPLYIMTCLEGGKKEGTCPDQSSTDPILQCVNAPVLGTQYPECRKCSPWGGSCKTNFDCCLGVAEKVPDWPLPFPIFPQCYQGKCIFCLHAASACRGMHIPSCASIMNYNTTVRCLPHVGYRSGASRGGHNSLFRWTFFPNLGADPCSKEAQHVLTGRASGKHVWKEASGRSYCWVTGGSRAIRDSRYRNSYFCACPKDTKTGYSCQVRKDKVGQLIGPKSLNPPLVDDGRRCLTCGLHGKPCGGKGHLRCCVNHVCNQKKKICEQKLCVLEGSQRDYRRKWGKCCPGLHRNIKDHRCTNNKCIQQKGVCDYGTECCGNSTVCKQTPGSTELETYCLPCTAEGEKCYDNHECCGGHPWYQTMVPGGDWSNFSTCDSGRCAKCVKKGAKCDQYSPPCCGGVNVECGSNGKCP